MAGSLSKFSWRSFSWSIDHTLLFRHIGFYFFIPNHLPGITYNMRLAKNGKEEKIELYGLIIDIKNGKYSIKNIN